MYFGITMKRSLFLILIYTLICFSAFSDFHNDESLDEPSLADLIGRKCILHHEKDDFYKVIWGAKDYRLEMNSQKGLFLKSPCLSDADKIHLEIYRQRDNQKILLPRELALPFESMVSLKSVPKKLFQLLITYDEKISFIDHPTTMKFWRSEFQELISYYKNILTPPFIATDELKDLYLNRPDLSSILDGKYEDSIRLFLFCRRNRDYPCLFTAKDKYDNPILTNDRDEIWRQPALAQSARLLSSNIVNGRTPQGVHTIDSVMPYADQYTSFGKFRRLILNWVPTDDNEEINDDLITKSLLSPLSEKNTWWRQASVSRDIGRTDLRIHGTGKRNDDSRTPYYPLRPSNGCITQREGLYGRNDYKDQRIILNQLMKGLELAVTYENEEKIKGILYLIELDDQKRPVEWTEVAKKIGLTEENQEI